MYKSINDFLQAIMLALCLALVAIVLQKFVLARDSQQLSQA